MEEITLLIKEIVRWRIKNIFFLISKDEETSRTNSTENSLTIVFFSQYAINH